MLDLGDGVRGMGEVGTQASMQARPMRGLEYRAPHLSQLEASAMVGIAAMLTSSWLTSCHMLYWTLLSCGCMLGQTLQGEEGTGFSVQFSRCGLGQ